MTTAMAQAFSRVLPPKPVINDVLIPDNSSWTGIKYNGVPINAGSNVIGSNVNYIYQLATYSTSDGGLTVQVYLKNMAPIAYTTALASLNNLNPSVIVGDSHVFQDSGVVFPRSVYLGHPMTTTNIGDWSWQIILSFKVNKESVSTFNSDLNIWVQGKLSQKTNSGNTTFYWK